MVDKKLVSYIRDGMKNGYSTKDIKDKLLKSGVGETEFNIALNEVVNVKGIKSGFKFSWKVFFIVLLVVVLAVGIFLLGYFNSGKIKSSSGTTTNTNTNINTKTSASSIDCSNKTGIQREYCEIGKNFLNKNAYYCYGDLGNFSVRFNSLNVSVSLNDYCWNIMARMSKIYCSNIKNEVLQASCKK